MNPDASESVVGQTRPGIGGVLLLLLLPLSALGQSYDLSWRTIDGGGSTFMTGGAFRLGGTTGQHDAGPVPLPVTGGTFVLRGGFWPGAGGDECPLPGDMNLDGTRDGIDVQGFVDCLIATGVNCPCADIDGNGSLGGPDVSAFVALLLP